MPAFLTLFKRFVRAILRRGLAFIATRPKFRGYVLAITRRLGLYPLARAVYARLVAASYRSGMRDPYGFIPIDIAHLTPRARQIYADLKAAIERRQKEKG